jgi:hypothetical protein
LQERKGSGDLIAVTVQTLRNKMTAAKTKNDNRHHHNKDNNGDDDNNNKNVRVMRAQLFRRSKRSSFSGLIDRHTLSFESR